MAGHDRDDCNALDSCVFIGRSVTGACAPRDPSVLHEVTGVQSYQREYFCFLIHIGVGDGVKRCSVEVPAMSYQGTPNGENLGAPVCGYVIPGTRHII